MINKKMMDDALAYHAEGRPGKIEVKPTKPYGRQRDLALAYSPGVAKPCLAIYENPDDAYKYTTKGNLVAVISNGSAVLGLGNIGALAGKPVMEGKGLLFKIYADIDVFDIEVDEMDVDKFVEIVKAISPTFGGINLEDIKAPECFEIEERLKKELEIPVMHDDQHGTAIISAAGLLNALELVDKKLENIRLVVNGAGASAVACTKLYISLGVKKENVVMLDSKGVLQCDRDDLSDLKKEFATQRKIYTLEEALKDADMFLGLSVANILNQDMLRSMAANPVVFALANPDPEIDYDQAIAAREDIIFATGRSDHPNQVNNVLGFPYIFRGALDVRSSKINEEMKIAAVKAIAQLAKEAVPEEVNLAYDQKNLLFGREYIIPKPSDPRLLTVVAPAVAKAAIETGVARANITDWDAYAENLSARLGRGNKLFRMINERCRRNPKRVVFAEADHFNILKAAQIVKNEGIAIPVLLGNRTLIESMIQEYELDLVDVEIIDPRSAEEKSRVLRYADILYKNRQRSGLSHEDAVKRILNRSYFGMMMVDTGDADTFVSGYATRLPYLEDTLMELIGVREDTDLIAGLSIALTKHGPLLFADTMVTPAPTPEQLVNITLLAEQAARKLGIDPKIALISYANFGAVEEGSPQRVKEAVNILHARHPDIVVDGEMQINFALDKDLRVRKFPFSKLGSSNVNTIIFPNLSSGHVASKLMKLESDAESVGPIVMGARKPIHFVEYASSVREIVNITSIAVIDAQFEQSGVKTIKR